MDKRMEARDKRLSRQRHKENQSHSPSRAEASSSSDSEGSDGDGDGDGDGEWVGKKRKRATGKKSLPAEVSTTHDRLQMSFRQRAMASAHAISATGGDMGSVSLSKSTLHRQAKKSRLEK